METGELDALRREVMRLFFSIGKQMKRRAAHALRGMPRMDFLTLYLIHDLAKKQGREEIWVSELVRRIHTPAPAVSRTLGSLEQKGYVRRAVDRADRRKTCMRVTPEGKAVLDGGFARFSDSCNGIFQALGPDKSRQLIALLKELEAAMEAQELDGRAPPSA